MPDRLYFAAMTFESAQAERIEFMNIARSMIRATIPEEDWPSKKLSDKQVLALLDAPRLEMAALLNKIEGHAERVLAAELKEHPLWPWLDGIRGIGPAIGGRFLSRVDPMRFTNVAKLWRFCGLAGDRWRERTDGKCLSCECSSFVRQRSLESHGTLAARGCRTCAHAPHPAGKYHHDPVLLGLLVGENGFADQFVKQRTPFYRDQYDARKLVESLKPACKTCGQYSHENQIPTAADAGAGGQERSADHDLRAACSGKHIERKARRYIVKKFLADFWAEAHRAAATPSLRTTYPMPQTYVA